MFATRCSTPTRHRRQDLRIRLLPGSPGASFQSVRTRTIRQRHGISGSLGEANMKKRVIIIAILFVAALSAAFAWKGRGDDRLAASGTLEARNISVGSKVGGRITHVLVHEGDRVEANQLLVVFDSAELEATLLQAQGRVDGARANLAKSVRGLRPGGVAEARAASEGFREAELAQARADLERGRSDEANAERELGRTERLAEARVVPQQELDNARDRYRAERARVQSYESAVAA